MRPLARLCVAVLTVPLLLGACTDEPSGTAGRPSAPTTSASDEPGDGASESVTPQPTADPQGAIDQLKDWTCEIRDGRWVAAGNFENPSTKRVTLTLAVAVVATGTREIVEESRHRFSVPAGATQAIDLPDVGPGTRGTTCTRWIIG